MRIFGFAGGSGSGKTTLIEQLIPRLKARGLVVSLIKEAHRKFDVDQPGKDSWRHRRAGCTEVLLTGGNRWALMHELRGAGELSLDGALARLLEAERDAYKVGAQGPDFLFYSRVWSGDPEHRKLALHVHQHRTHDTFEGFFAHALRLPADERAIALAFACGYAAHLCLDAEAHPWIMYWSGDITDRADPGTQRVAFGRHGLLESSVDVMLRQRRSADPAWLRRAGLLRGREFIMKDSYSFDIDDEGLEKAYQIQRDAYIRIFERLGIEYVIVQACLLYTSTSPRDS